MKLPWREKLLKWQRYPDSVLHREISEMAAIVYAVHDVCSSGMLPDGDHVNEPTRMWLEEILAFLRHQEEQK